MQQRYRVCLNASQREELASLVKSGRTLARTICKARILLGCDRSQGHSRRDEEVAQIAGCDAQTVMRTRRRFVEGGLELALHDKPRPGAKPKITGEVEAHLVALACSAPPQDRNAWTLVLLADKLVELRLVESISPTQVGVRLKKTLSNPGKSNRGA